MNCASCRRHHHGPHTHPHWDLDALLAATAGASMDADKINTITSAAGHRAAAGQGGPLRNVLADTGAFGGRWAHANQLIGEVINNLNAVLATVDAKSAAIFGQCLVAAVSGLAKNRGSDRGRHFRAGVDGSYGTVSEIRAGRCKGHPGKRPPLATGAGQPKGRVSTTTSSSSARTTCACPRWAVTDSCGARKRTKTRCA